MHIRTSLFLRGLRCWILAVLLAFLAWQWVQLAPLAGLIGIGVAPFADLYLFLRGVHHMHQALQQRVEKNNADQEFSS